MQGMQLLSRPRRPAVGGLLSARFLPPAPPIPPAATCRRRSRTISSARASSSAMEASRWGGQVGRVHERVQLGGLEVQEGARQARDQVRGLVGAAVLRLGRRARLRVDRVLRARVPALGADTVVITTALYSTA